MKTLGLRRSGLAWVTPAGGLLISRLKVRFLHGSPLDRGAATPPDSLCRARGFNPFQPVVRSYTTAFLAAASRNFVTLSVVPELSERWNAWIGFAGSCAAGLSA